MQRRARESETETHSIGLSAILLSIRADRERKERERGGEREYIGTYAKNKRKHQAQVNGIKARIAELKALAFNARTEVDSCNMVLSYMGAGE